jgi:catechol 2,3-dioxygenase-like lactoylglutathione lyase family enzyme
MADERGGADARPGMTLRVEVFPDDLDAFVRFYTDVLGFTLTTDQRDSDTPYAAVEHGSVRIGAARAWEPVERGARAVPTGVEIVLEVDDVAEAHRRVRTSGYPLEQGLTLRPWGLTDFRVLDPAGYYLRITGRG